MSRGGAASPPGRDVMLLPRASLVINGVAGYPSARRAGVVGPPLSRAWRSVTSCVHNVPLSPLSFP